MAGFIQGRLASGAEVSSIKEALGFEIPQDWRLDAECARLGKDGKPLYDPDLWFVEKRPAAREARTLGVLTSKQAVDKAMSICNTLCPVRAECREAASYEDRRTSVRGGIRPASGEDFVADGQSPTVVWDPMVMCKRGHNLTAPNGRTPSGKCRLCKQLRERLGYVPDVVKSKDDTTDTAA